MTMIGIDPHKATHTAVAVDDDENVIDEFMTTLIETPQTCSLKFPTF